METIISWIMTVPKGTMLFSAYGSGYSWASFTYSRNGVTLLTKTAYNGRVEGSVWDDLIHWGEAYTTKFSWNHG